MGLGVSIDNTAKEKDTSGNEVMKTESQASTSTDPIPEVTANITVPDGTPDTDPSTSTSTLVPSNTKTTETALGASVTIKLNKLDITESSRIIVTKELLDSMPKSKYSVQHNEDLPMLPVDIDEPKSPTKINRRAHKINMIFNRHYSVLVS